MNRQLPLGIVLAMWLAAGAVEALAQQPPPPKPKPAGLVTLSGCVTATPNDRKVFTLADQEQTYRLTGTDVRQYVGQHVEVLGALPKRLRIVGGLYPSPNVAAQAGDMDPAKAAMAAQAGPARTGAQLVEFSVKSVRVTEGTCSVK